ncbi:hypothetical protein BDW42DRAFT_121747 [Aspergillus taichungensis]|uniref:Uncharacterized protein n=1 Tax=Aspergillus taichungensis TaxID=482145 RepID=A0A2J5I810_9EURO|nr:hypothetical protein BDW42DRAFT_121747 [Aspergillus taichungensis]
MVTRGLWNLHVDGKWYRWFHPPRGQSSSPDSPTTLRTIQQILSKSDDSKWEAVPFPTPLHFQLDYVYTVDKDAGHFIVTRWKKVNGGLYPRAQRATLASVQETPLDTLDTLLDDVVVAFKPNDSPLIHANDETDMQHLLKSFKIKSRIPARLNELQFQLFTDFVFTWRFYLDDTSTWEHSFSIFSTLAIGILRIAAWDFEIRDTDTEDLPITFSSLPRWKAPTDDIFWFHRYLIVYCKTDEISTVATKARCFVSRSTKSPEVLRGIAISIRHIALFEICDGDIICSPPIPLVTNTSALCCSPGFRILAYIFTSNPLNGLSLKSGERWGISIPTELFDMILKASTPKDLISMAQASILVEKWYYHSIPQFDGLRLQNFSLSIPCCGIRNSSSHFGVHCSICYSWSHMGCADLSTGLPSDIDRYICPECQANRPCTVLETGGIHQAYREKRELKACKVVHGGKTTDFRLRDSKPASRRPELWLIRSLGPPPPEDVSYAIFFNDIFSGLAYGFD